MNEVKPFNFQGNQVRTVLIEDVPYFVGKDSALAIGYTNDSFRNAIKYHVKAKYKRECQINTPSGIQTMTVISEPGIYQLAGQSKLPSAEPFQDWIYEQVLPSIRKHGAYLTDKKAYDITHNPNGIADLLLQAGQQLKQKELVIQEMKPKAIFADAVETSHTSILVGELAKLIKQNGVNIGPNRLFQWLRSNGYLVAGNRSDRNMPTQKSLELGLFGIKERNVQNPDGSIRVTKTPKVTGKGQQYFINKFLSRVEV